MTSRRSDYQDVTGADEQENSVFSKSVETAARPTDPNHQQRPMETPRAAGEPCDATLLGLSADGDASAYRQLVERYLAWVLGIARLMLRDRAEAEDVAQDVMLRLWRKGAALDIGPGGLRPWLRRVVSNLCIDRLRSIKAKRVVPADELPESSGPAGQLVALSEKELAQRVHDALQDLPDRQRLALVLFQFDGLSQMEIALLMDLSQDAVESLLARARRRLKVLLQDDWKLYLPDAES